MESRRSGVAGKSRPPGRCQRGSLEKGRRHSWLVSSRTTAGARTSQKSAISRLHARLRRAKGNQRSEIEEQTAKSEYFGRNLWNLFSRFLSILLPLIAEHHPDCLRLAHQSFHRHCAGCACRSAINCCGRVRVIHTSSETCFDYILHLSFP